ncbi:hypothetical protein ACQ4PT_034710 [Festuca glaucescens]
MIQRFARHCATKHHHHHGADAAGSAHQAPAAPDRGVVGGDVHHSLGHHTVAHPPPFAPRFSLLAATAAVSGPNATGIARLDAAFVAHNPNTRATALYDRLQLRASYAGGQLAATAEPFEQTQGDVVLTALMSSSSSVAPAAAADVGETAAGGRSTLLLKLRVEGHLRWKVAAWVSGRHALVAECVAVVVLEPSQSRARRRAGIPVRHHPQ